MQIEIMVISVEVMKYPSGMKVDSLEYENGADLTAVYSSDCFVIVATLADFYNKKMPEPSIALSDLSVNMHTHTYHYVLEQMLSAQQ